MEGWKSSACSGDTRVTQELRTEDDDSTQMYTTEVNSINQFYCRNEFYFCGFYWCLNACNTPTHRVLQL